MAAARTAFEAALRACPRHEGARTGLGYVALRQDRTDEARRLFDAVVADAPRNVDALVGLGIAAWRAEDREAARSAFTRAQAIDPDNAEARDFLARLGPPPAARAQRGRRWCCRRSWRIPRGPTATASRCARRAGGSRSTSRA